LRAEDYSDFGSNLSGKFAGRYDFTSRSHCAARCRTAPRAVLQQQYFATTSTNFINGVPYDITTSRRPTRWPRRWAPSRSMRDVGELLARAVVRVSDVTITLDAYRIDIDDRIVLSENLTQANVRQYLESLGFIGVGGGRFFINGVDTETKGVDLVVNWPWETSGAGKFDFTFVANWNDTEVTRCPPPRNSTP